MSSIAADTPLLAALSRFATSFATSPARGAVGLGVRSGHLTLPLAGRVAQLGRVSGLAKLGRGYNRG